MSRSYPWKDKAWQGVSVHGHVAYEMHIGTFTEKGTFNSAIKELPRLARLGITLIEILPINGFPGHFGWGYDGVNFFAPFQLDFLLDAQIITQYLTLPVQLLFQ